MQIYVLIISETLLFLAMLWWFGFMWETIMNHRPGRVVYQATNLREQGPLLTDIIKKYGIKTETTDLVEPGAGTAVVSRYLSKRFKWHSVEAIELGRYIYTLGKLRGWFSRNPVTFRRQNLFSYAYQPNSFIYCYLFPALVTRLYEEGKLEGSLVISLTFPIDGCPATEEISLRSWQKRLLVYDFRKTAAPGKL